MNFFLAAWHTLDTLITPHQFLHINNIFCVCVKWNERFMIWYSNVSFWKKNSSLLVACYYYYISNTFRGLVMSSWLYMYCHYHLHAQGTDNRQETIKWKKAVRCPLFGDPLDNSSCLKNDPYVISSSLKVTK